MKKKIFTYETGMLIVLFLAFGLVFMDRFSFTFLMPYIQEDLGLNFTESGIVMGILSVFFGLSTLIFSGLSDLMGKKKPVLIAFVVLFSFATLTAGFIGSFATMVVIRSLMGITEGPVIPLVQSTVIAESSDERRGRNLGIVKGAGPLMSGVLAPMILIPIAVAYGWRYAFYSLAIPGFIIAFLVYKFIKEPKMTSSPEDKPSFKELVKIIKVRNVWLIMVLCIFYMINMTSFVSFAPMFIRNSLGFTAGQSSTFLTMYGVGCFFWFVAVPWLSDRFGRKPTLVFFALFSGALPLAVATLNASFGLLVVLVFLLAFGMGYMPLFDSIIPGESVDKKYIATAMALIVLTGEVIGGTLGPIISGYFSDKFDLHAPFYVGAISAGIAFLLTLGIKETAPGKLRQSKLKTE